MLSLLCACKVRRNHVRGVRFENDAEWGAGGCVWVRGVGGEDTDYLGSVKVRAVRYHTWIKVTRREWVD